MGEPSIDTVWAKAPNHRYRILLVDDDPANVHALNQSLKREYDVLLATGGRQAIELCRRELPDLVLADVVMPGMDGFQLCRALKRDPDTRHIPVIFVTARDGVEDQEAGFEAGGVDFITKPVSPPIVRARARTHLFIKHQADLLRSMAFIDGLTTVANWRYFDESLRNEWRRCCRSQTPLAVVILDIDHFRAYNESCGHQAGDRCLQELARIMKDQLQRPGDFIARYGGDEFVCLLPETGMEGAFSLADTLGRAVERLGIRHGVATNGGGVTVSRGVAALVPTAEIEPYLLVDNAYAGLSEAKEGGRNITRFGGQSR